MKPAILIEAITRCRGRLELAEKRAARVETDAEAIPVLADIESTLTSLGVTLGLERRAAVLRLRAQHTES